MPSRHNCIGITFFFLKGEYNSYYCVYQYIEYIKLQNNVV